MSWLISTVEASNAGLVIAHSITLSTANGIPHSGTDLLSFSDGRRLSSP